MNTNKRPFPKYTEYGDCPKCGYRLIKIHPTARCAKNTCGFEMSWEEYKSYFLAEPINLKI